MRIHSAMVWFSLLSFMTASCVVERDDHRRELTSFYVEVVAPPSGCQATEDDPCPFSLDPVTVHLKITALRPDGTMDTDYNDTVALALVPSGMWPNGTPDTYGLPGQVAGEQAVKIVTIQNGQGADVPVTFQAGFDVMQIMVEDLGYRPKQVTNECLTHGADCPACWSSGHAELGTGCLSTDDDNPEAGTGAVGVSRDFVFDTPTVADVQRVDKDHIDESPLSGYRVLIEGDNANDFSSLNDCVDGQGHTRALLVVTAVTTQGFYLTDVCNNGGPLLATDTWRDFGSIYAFNFNSPENLRTGDCITLLQGGEDDFNGFTELKNPAWSDPTCIDGQAGCPPACAQFLPEPLVLDGATIRDDFAMEKLEASLVAVQNVTVGHSARCDTNGNGQVDYDVPEEKQCKFDCEDDPACWVYETYTQYFQYTVDVDGQELAVVTQGVVPFDPNEHEGETISYIAGTLKQLSFGGPPWILLPRTADDFRQ
ncbi:MAG: hypothetical protein J7M25_12935 [Deltaproteobacteria bacterium]|nr:hypothetical protein [Deltaproteobacteria bacterium]